MKLSDDLDEVPGRLRHEQTVQESIYEFLDDKSFNLFEAFMDNKDYAEALGIAHTLKRIYQSLSFTRLFESSSLAIVALKEDNWNKALSMMPQLPEDYHVTINAIEELRISKKE